MERRFCMKRIVCLLMIFQIVSAADYHWEPKITEAELNIEPYTWETCYQYAERKVQQMKKKYSNRRIVGSDWLSDYWAHHYEGALIQRNYFWQPV